MINVREFSIVILSGVMDVVSFGRGSSHRTHNLSIKGRVDFI
jgi:hypothetical protein